jgi:dTDP-glucose 4,6-dehydratase
VKLLVTGAAGFIGSTYVRTVLDSRPGDEVVVLDKLTYAGRRENLAGIEDRIDFRVGAIEDRAAVREAMTDCDAVSTSRPSRTSTGRSPARTASRSRT